jgi:hypothetical protein
MKKGTGISRIGADSDVCNPAGVKTQNKNLELMQFPDGDLKDFVRAELSTLKQHLAQIEAIHKTLPDEAQATPAP